MCFWKCMPASGVLKRAYEQSGTFAFCFVEQFSHFVVKNFQVG